MRRLLAALASPLAATFALAAAPAPRDAVAEIAQAIEENYYDAAKAKTLADGLRNDAAAGNFDALADPVDLADALTTRLRPEDGHFRVQWGTDEDEPGAPPAGAPKMVGSVAQFTRSNYGFRGIEILPGNVAVIDMRGFAPMDASNPDDPGFRAANAALAVAANADAVIFDLSNSRGGSPAMVGYLVSAFVAPDADVYNIFHARDGDGSEKPPIPHAKPRTDVPLFVVTGSTTGSGAESFAYTLQAAQRALTVGEVTAGRANPGQFFPMKSGFQIFISVGSPENPITHANWEKTGVTPDIAVPVTEARMKAYALAVDAILKKGVPDDFRTEVQWVHDALNAPATDFTAADYEGSYDTLTVTADGNSLTLAKPGRAPWRLKPLGGDLFFVDGLPTQRFHFLRDEGGSVSGVEDLSAYGQIVRLKRS